jgi:hypothetical protein
MQKVGHDKQDSEQRWACRGGKGSPGKAVKKKLPVNVLLGELCGRAIRRTVRFLEAFCCKLLAGFGWLAVTD